jgi:hypothetical protein
MIVQHTNKVHEAACIAAEGTRQQEVAAAAGNQSAVRTAEIKFYRALVVSAVANNLPSSQFYPALLALGTGGV